jgi:hypothetical protein
MVFKSALALDIFGSQSLRLLDRIGDVRDAAAADLDCCSAELAKAC